jgi:hypothetical protein
MDIRNQRRKRLPAASVGSAWGKANHKSITAALLIICCLALTVSGCFQQSTRLGQDQILDITWKSLEPSTSSQNRGNWEIVEVSRVLGREVIDEFPGLQISNCPGPTPPENGAIRFSSEYWYVRVMPRHLLSAARKSPSASAPNAIAPEPLFRDAQFLIDPVSGHVIARRYICQRSEE